MAGWNRCVVADVAAPGAPVRGPVLLAADRFCLYAISLLQPDVFTQLSGSASGDLVVNTTAQESPYFRAIAARKTGTENRFPDPPRVSVWDERPNSHLEMLAEAIEVSSVGHRIHSIPDPWAPVKDLVAGRTFQRPTGGFVGVANVGMDANWLGSPLAMANLYGFGRLAWDPNLSAETIVDEWTRLTFGHDPVVVQTLSSLQLSSWRVYERYTGPLGVGTLTNILGNHYDPGPESSEQNGWGQWHRADHAGIGMDRTVATGTGYIGQYPPAVQKQYESLANCPDDFLLFFHHVPYTYVLHSGKTVIQHFYDEHYEGADRASGFVTQWTTLKGHVNDERYRDIMARLQYQADEAVVWRDAINKWIYGLSGVADEKGRVGAEHRP